MTRLSRSNKFDFYSVEDASGSVHYIIEVAGSAYHNNEVDDAAVIIMYEFINRFGSTIGDKLSIMSRDKYKWWRHPYRQFILYRYGYNFEIEYLQCFDYDDRYNCTDKSIARGGWI